MRRGWLQSCRDSLIFRRGRSRPADRAYLKQMSSALAEDSVGERPQPIEADYLGYFVSHQSAPSISEY